MVTVGRFARNISQRLTCLDDFASGKISWHFVKIHKFSRIFAKIVKAISFRPYFRASQIYQYEKFYDAQFWISFYCSICTKSKKTLCYLPSTNMNLCIWHVRLPNVQIAREPIHLGVHWLLLFHGSCKQLTPVMYAAFLLIPRNKKIPYFWKHRTVKHGILLNHRFSRAKKHQKIDTLFYTLLVITKSILHALWSKTDMNNGHLITN